MGQQQQTGIPVNTAHRINASLWIRQKTYTTVHNTMRHCDSTLNLSSSQHYKFHLYVAKDSCTPLILIGQEKRRVSPNQNKSVILIVAHLDFRAYALGTLQSSIGMKSHREAFTGKL